jgi:prepilin-type processing-associated H-X9-DG protein
VVLSVYQNGSCHILFVDGRFCDFCISYCSVVVVGGGEVNSAVANLAPTLVIFTLQL